MKQHRRSLPIMWTVLASLGLHIVVATIMWGEKSRAAMPVPTHLSARLISSADSIELQKLPMPAEATDTPKVTSVDRLIVPISNGMASVPDTHYFYADRELTNLPWIPGEPVFDFSRSGLSDSAINGSLDFELLIDEFGKVVTHQVLTVAGLDHVIETLLVNQFAKYPFYPAQIGERAVKSRIRFHIEIANGRQQVPVPSASE